MKSLEEKFGGRWFGISIFGLDVTCKDDFHCPQVSNVCEALKTASIGKVLLKPCELSYVGARFAFGCGGENKQAIVEQTIHQHGFSRAYAEQVVERTPHCKVPTGSIGIGIQDNPEVWVARLQPDQVMAVVRVYQTRFEKSFQPEISSVVSICGTVIVGALQRQDMTIALGCDTSRDGGCLTRDRMFVGLPATIAKQLVL